MTTAQKALYWRTWSAVLDAHNLRVPPPELPKQRKEVFVGCDIDAQYQSWWEIGGELARQRKQSTEALVTAEDLRYSAHIIALGRSVSSKALTNSELDRVLALFHLLVDPDNLNHVMAWEDMEAGEKRRLHYAITKTAPAPYWGKVAADKFGTSDLDRLELAQLRQLALTVRLRMTAKQRKASAAVQSRILHPESSPS